MSTHKKTLEPRAEYREIVNTWLTNLNSAIQHEDPNAFADCILPRGWLRDLLVFSWDFKSLCGREAIASYLSGTCGLSDEVHKIFNLKLKDDAPEGRTHLSPFGLKQTVQAALRFETPRAWGRGYVYLPYDEHNSADRPDAKPKAITLFLMISDWKGHEEMGHEFGTYNGHNLSWEEVREHRRADVERDPSVIIIGAGQTGLQIAARFRQMNIRALIVEKNARVGDNWRHRYPTLTLHSPRKHHTLLYQPYPSNWPKYTPKDKLASWLEQYAKSQDLLIWLSSKLEPGPTYDYASRRWKVFIERNGERIEKHPKHIVVATGIFGDPRIPSFPGQDEFKGTIIHANAYAGGSGFTGKDVVVVGAGNSSADICQDLVVRGASGVTMVQRSATAVVSDKSLSIRTDPIFAENRSLEYIDLALQAVPFGAVREAGKEMQPVFRESDKEMLDGLEKAGLQLTEGLDGSGQGVMIFTRSGGYWIDFGCAKLIIDGVIKVKQGCEIVKLTCDSIIFSDGTEIKTDAIILATGWLNVRDALRKTFGDDVMNNTSEIWGIDEEGEVRGGYKPSGQPGLWFAAGAFEYSRFYSKQLALFIKAEELGFFRCPST